MGRRTFEPRNGTHRPQPLGENDCSFDKQPPAGPTDPSRKKAAVAPGFRDNGAAPSTGRFHESSSLTPKHYFAFSPNIFSTLLGLTWLTDTCTSRAYNGQFFSFESMTQSLPNITRSATVSRLCTFSSSTARNRSLAMWHFCAPTIPHCKSLQ